MHICDPTVTHTVHPLGTGRYILPWKHLGTVKEEEVVLLYAILKGYKFSVGKIIENSILSYYRGSYMGLVPHLALIIRLCILGGVEGDWEEEETCHAPFPRLSRQRGREPQLGLFAYFFRHWCAQVL